jgi:TolB-like protein/DNA-binding winged helix-turn-helix (wHTH) protein/Tfp pilus assembly protein PilF
MSQQDRHFYEFGSFRLDASERLLLRRDGARVQLTEKAFDTLVALVRRGGHLVSKEELMAEVWPDTAVEENNLDKSISAIRQALGEKASAPEYVETVRGRGYRFMARVSEVRDEGVGQTRAQGEEGLRAEPAHANPDAGARPATQGMSPPSTSHAWRRPFKTFPLLLCVGVLALGLGVAVYFWRAGRAAGQAESAPVVSSIAVLPFKPLSADSRDESLELGMAETLITRLGNIKQFVVRPISAVRQYTDPNQDPVKAGRELQTEAVLDGSIQKAGERIRVTVRLINVRTGAALWAEQFDTDFTDIFDVQDSISERVTKSLTHRLSGEEKRNLTKRYTDNPEAYQLYLQGHYLWTKRGEGNLRKSFEYYQRAIEKDPNFALAYVGMAESNLLLMGTASAPAREMVPQAIASMTKALELDPTLAEAHNTLAEIKYQYEYDWAGAEREFKEAIELNPNAALIRLAHGWFLMVLGRFDEARAEMERAQELDPSSMIINRARGRLFYFTRQYGKAIEHYRKILEVEPHAGVTHWCLAEAYVQQGMYAEAIEEYSKAGSLDRYLSPEEDQELRETYSASGWEGYQRKWAAEVEERSKDRYISQTTPAHNYSRLGERDHALAWLEKAFEARDPALTRIGIEPVYDPLRADARFRNLSRRVGLTP